MQQEFRLSYVENAVQNIQGLHRNASGISRTPEKPLNEAILTAPSAEKLGFEYRLGSDAVQKKDRFWTRVYLLKDRKINESQEKTSLGRA